MFHLAANPLGMTQLYTYEHPGLPSCSYILHMNDMKYLPQYNQ